jgi:hypothetical protein
MLSIVVIIMVMVEIKVQNLYVSLILKLVFTINFNVIIKAYN